MATLTLGLQNLRRQVDAAFPDRKHISDGWIGDAAHRARTSGHNPDDTSGSRPAWNGDPDTLSEVRAWDCDSDLGPGVAAQALVDHVRQLSNLGQLIRYMIYNRRMYHERDGFAPTTYTGDSPHTEHIHFEGAWTQAADNNQTFDFHLEEIPVALTADDKKWIAADNDRAARSATADLLAAKIGDVAFPDRRVADVLRDVAKLRGVLVGDPGDTKNAALSPTSPLAKLLAVPAELQKLPRG